MEAAARGHLECLKYAVVLGISILAVQRLSMVIWSV